MELSGGDTFHEDMSSDLALSISQQYFSTFVPQRTSTHDLMILNPTRHNW